MTRAVVTGWHLAMPLAQAAAPAAGVARHAPGTRWRSWTHDDAQVVAEGLLRPEFQGGLVLSPHFAAEPFPCVLARAARDLARLGLWDKTGPQLDPLRMGVCFSASKPNFPACAEEPLEAGCDMPLTAWRRATGAEGVGYAPVAACAGGAHSVALAAQLIEDGYVDMVVAGGYEAPHSEMILAGYRNAGALSKRGVMLPFHAQRDGFVPSAGSATLVVESEEHARKRGVPILAVLAGTSMQADATAMTTMEASGESIARAIEIAMLRAGGNDPEYINAHGTATKRNDIVETRAIRLAFGGAVPVSATKPMTGHWMGAAGALEAIICLQAMRESWLPPTKHLDSRDEECDLDYIAMDGREMPLQRTMSLSYGFGGHIGVLVLEKL